MPLAILTFLRSPIARYIGLALLIAGAVWFVAHQWNGYKEGLRQEGRDEMAAKVQETIRLNDKNNRNLEQSLQTTLNQYGQKLDQSLSAMDAKAKQSTQTIRQIIHDRPQIFNNPVCNTPPDVITERNRIREQGPQ